jgi:hypothetical protein
MAANNDFYTAAERRIEYIAIGIGVAGTAAALIFWGFKPAEGVALGAAFSCINYRWMRLGVAVMAGLAKAQQGAEKVRVPGGTYFKVMGRYVLLILGAYVILHFLNLSIVSLLAGFSAVLAAVLVELVGQIFRNPEIPRANI